MVFVFIYKLNIKRLKCKTLLTKLFNFYYNFLYFDHNNIIGYHRLLYGQNFIKVLNKYFGVKNSFIFIYLSNIQIPSVNKLSFFRVSLYIYVN